MEFSFEIFKAFSVIGVVLGVLHKLVSEVTLPAPPASTNSATLPARRHMKADR